MIIAATAQVKPGTLNRAHPNKWCLHDVRSVVTAVAADLYYQSCYVNGTAMAMDGTWYSGVAGYRGVIGIGRSIGPRVLRVPYRKPYATGNPVPWAPPVAGLSLLAAQHM
jgi:hypothetical protein